MTTKKEKPDGRKRQVPIWHEAQPFKVAYTNRLPITRRICRLLVSGYTINAVCARDDMPTKPTFAKWLMRDSVLADEVLKAKRLAAYFNIDDINELADDATETSAGVMKARLQVDTRKWAAERLLPKIYGKAESLEVTQTKAPDTAVLADVIDKVVRKLQPPAEEVPSEGA